MKTAKGLITPKRSPAKRPLPKKCPKCGYGHVIRQSLPGCPMCKVCSGCNKELMKCDCREGE